MKQSDFPIGFGKTMPPKQHEQSSNDVEQQERQQLSAKIGNDVLRTLGQPSDLHRLQVRVLWKDHYRVNVLVGMDILSSKVAHSYFVVGDSDGKVLTSAPQITRKYRPSTPALADSTGNN